MRNAECSHPLLTSPNEGRNCKWTGEDPSFVQPHPGGTRSLPNLGPEGTPAGVGL